MGFELTSKDYVENLKKAYVKIHESGDYITELDAVTGDGDRAVCGRKEKHGISL